METDIIKVSAQSNAHLAAGALANRIRELGEAEMQVIGAGALNQGIKSIIIARGYLGPEGIDITCEPSFIEVTINGESRTAIRLIIRKK